MFSLLCCETFQLVFFLFAKQTSTSLLFPSDLSTLKSSTFKTERESCVLTSPAVVAKNKHKAKKLSFECLRSPRQIHTRTQFFLIRRAQFVGNFLCLHAFQSEILATETISLSGLKTQRFSFFSYLDGMEGGGLNPLGRQQRQSLCPRFNLHFAARKRCVFAGAPSIIHSRIIWCGGAHAQFHPERRVVF